MQGVSTCLAMQTANPNSETSTGIPHAEEPIASQAMVLPDRVRKDLSPRDGLMAQETIAYKKLKSFCACIMKKLATPLLREVQASTLRPKAEPFMPKRTTRAAKRNAASCTAKPKPAENVLLRALGLVPEDMVVDEAAVSELQQLFDSPLREQHVRIIVALFGKNVPSSDELANEGATAISVA